MARKKASAGPKVVAIPVEGAREFVTIGPDAPVWSIPEAAARFGVSEAFIQKQLGGPPPFFRIAPPPEASEESVAAVRERCIEAGAVKVTVIRGRKAAAVTAPKEKLPHRKGREVVLELVEESTFPDKDLLREFCEVAMARRRL